MKYYALFVRDKYNGKWTDWQFVGTSTSKKVAADVGKGLKMRSNRGPSYTNYKVVPSPTRRRTLVENLGKEYMQQNINAAKSTTRRSTKKKR